MSVALIAAGTLAKMTRGGIHGWCPRQPCGKEGDERDNEEAQEDHVKCQIDEAARTTEVDERADGQHGEPRRNVDDVGKCLGQYGRSGNAGGVQQESGCHAENAELVP